MSYIQHNNYSFIAQCYLLATPIMTLLPDWFNPSFLIFDICSSGGANTPASYAAKFADRPFSVNRLQTG